MYSIFDVRIQYFLKAIRYPSILEASKKIGLTQPALSQAISKLERDLGIKLLERNSRGIKLSQSGRLFVNSIELYQKKIEDEFKDLSLPQNLVPLRIGSVAQFGSQILAPA